MSTVTPIGGGHLALGAGPETQDPNPPNGPSATAPDAVAATPAVPLPSAGDNLYINPQFRVDPQSGVVMLQYRDQSGKLVHQVPSDYELRSYRQLGQAPGKTSSS
jgi:hypothetical protein